MIAGTLDHRILLRHRRAEDLPHREFSLGLEIVRHANESLSRLDLPPPATLAEALRPYTQGSPRTFTESLASYSEIYDHLQSFSPSHAGPSGEHAESSGSRKESEEEEVDDDTAAREMEELTAEERGRLESIDLKGDSSVRIASEDTHVNLD